MKEKIKKYFADILILGGIWIFFYTVYFPGGDDFLPTIRLGYDYLNHFKFIGIVLITIGVDIAIRRYFTKRNSK